jgi:transposase
MANYYFGIDVSKKTLDVALLTEGNIVSAHVIENDQKAIQNFFQPYSRQIQLAGDEAWICMEHTGIYNYPLLEVLEKLKFKICLESALQIIKSQGMTRGKSDAIDARRIAQYAYKNREELKIWRPQRPVLQKIKALLSQRERLVKVKGQLETPIQECAGFLDSQIVKTLKSSTMGTLKAIEKDLKKLEAKIDDLVHLDKKLSTQYQRATSVTGIGPITALHMIVASGEFEQIKKPKQFACHAGVAPFERTSGISIKGRTRVSKMADLSLKKLLHMAALSAIQCEGEMKAYYARKVEEGKNRMSVINAVRNKLISRVFVCINQNRDYKKTYHHELA